MTDAELIRAVYPRHPMKLLARLMGVPVNTARHWLYVRLCAARRRELALKLLAEWDEQDRRRAEVRRQLKAMVGNEQSFEMGSAGDGAAVQETRAQTLSATTDEGSS